MISSADTCVNILLLYSKSDADCQILLHIFRVSVASAIQTSYCHTKIPSVFPGASLPTVTELTKCVVTGSSNGLLVESVSNIGPHYARTLREWRRRFVGGFGRIERGTKDFINEDIMLMHPRSVEGQISQGNERHPRWEGRDRQVPKEMGILLVCAALSCVNLTRLMVNHSQLLLRSWLRHAYSWR